MLTDTDRRTQAHALAPALSEVISVSKETRKVKNIIFETALMPFTKNYRRNYSMPKMASFLRHSVETVLLTFNKDLEPKTKDWNHKVKAKAKVLQYKDEGFEAKTKN